MELDENLHLRAYGKYFNRDRFVTLDDEDRPDDWDMMRGGFRMDWEGKDGYALTVQGDTYGSGRVGHSFTEPLPFNPFSIERPEDQGVEGTNVLFRLQREVDDRNGWSLQGYYDRTERASSLLSEDRDTFDLEYRHYFALGDRHDIIWGTGFRHSSDDVGESTSLHFQDTARTTRIFSAFVQDTITLIEDRLALMAGTKLSHNDFTGSEVQPSARLSWTPDDKQTIWTAFSRAMRTPSRVNDDFDVTIFYVPFPQPTRYRILGDRSVESEELLAYEIGYRVQPTRSLTLDLTAFVNDYDKLIQSVASRTNPFAFVQDNDHTAESYGVEFAAAWDVTDRWCPSGEHA